MKIQLDHSVALIKNANKFLDPLKQAYEVLGSQNQHFIGNLKDLDVSHANNLAETTKIVKEMIKENLGKYTDLIKKTAEKQQVTFKKLQKAYTDKSERADKAYLNLINNFDKNEDNFRKGEGSQLERDLWFMQY